MENNVAIRVDKLSKQYRIGLEDEKHDTIGATFVSFLRSPLRNLRKLRRLTRFGDGGDANDSLWALKDISFDVNQGEVLGIVGHNGAGKSTLLKILSRITEPTQGKILLRGRVASLLEVGTGFHPELTGRENVYLNGTILGMSRAEIDHKFDEIVEFSGVAKYIDTPVKRYSSGMRVRLAFSVAAHLDPEILLIDEVLAVGDAAFQKKCLGKMDDIATGGRTVLFVSHNMSAVTALCGRCIYLEGGQIKDIDDATTIVTKYLRDSTFQVGSQHINTHNPNSPLSFESAELRATEQGEFSRTTLKIRLTCRASEILPFTLEWRLITALGTPIAFGSPEQFQRESLMTEEGRFEIDLTINDMPLGAGQYYLSFHVGSQKDKVYYDIFEQALVVDILAFDPYGTGRSFTPKTKNRTGNFHFADSYHIRKIDNLSIISTPVQE